jgi:hypothetical protein
MKRSHAMITGIVVITVILAAIAWCVSRADVLAQQYGSCQFDIGSTGCSWGIVKTVTPYCSTPDVWISGIQIGYSQPHSDCGLGNMGGQ